MNPLVISISAYVWPYVRVTVNTLYEVFIDTEEIPHDDQFLDRITDILARRGVV